MIAAGAAVRLARIRAGDAPYDPAPVALLDARRVPGCERPWGAQVLAGTPGHVRDDTAPDPGDLPADAKRRERASVHDTAFWSWELSPSDTAQRCVTLWRCQLGLVLVSRTCSDPRRLSGVRTGDRPYSHRGMSALRDPGASTWVRRARECHRGVKTQNSLPSGSAITTQLTLPWPMSIRVAPKETRRSTSAC